MLRSSSARFALLLPTLVPAGPAALDPPLVSRLGPAVLPVLQEHPTAPIEAGRLRPSHEQYLEECAEGFTDPDPERRRTAILDVSRAGDAATPMVAERLRETRNPLGQRSAILALYEIGTPTASSLLEQAMASEELKEEERAVLFLVLGARASSAAVPMLRTAAAERRATPAARAATLALGRLSDVEGLVPLVERASREPLAERRAAIVAAAGATGDRRLLPGLVPLLGDDADAVRRAAAFAVGEIGEAVELEFVLAQGRRERDDRVRAAIALAWGRIDHPSAREALERATHDRSDGVRNAAWAALAARADGAESVAEALGKERSADLRLVLARASAAGRGDALAQALVSRLADRDARVRAAAGRALAAQGVDDEPQALLDWFGQESDEAARRDAALVAGVLLVPGALDVLAARPLDGPLGGRVERALRGRLDPRVLAEELERRLREEGGRLSDRRDAELAALVAFALDLDDVDRLGPGDGGGPGPLPVPGGKPRVDRRPASYERDLLEWFDDAPYFEASAERTG